MDDQGIGISTIGGSIAGAAIMPSQIQVNPPPTEEVVPGVAGWLPLLNFALPRSIDDLTVRLTQKVYDAMLTDPAVASSFYAHKMSILAGGVKLVSPVKQPAWSKVQPKGPPKAGAPPMPNAQPAPEAGDGNPDQKLSPEQEQAKEVYEFCERAWNRIRVTRDAALFELLDAMAYGSKMAEMVYEVPEEGVDAGKLVWKDLKVKPNWGWRFIVDNRFNVMGFLTFNPLGGYLVYPEEKFIWLSWMPVDCDPRGKSLLRAAYNAWNLKIQAWPQHYRHMVRFGTPGLDFEMAPGDNTPQPSIGANGLPLNNGQTMTPGVYYATLLGVYQNGGVFVHPNGSKLQIAEPQSKGEVWQLAIDLYNREIKLAIEYQTRASLEAQHGSRADSETATDVKALVTTYGREWLGNALFKGFKHLVNLNFGKEAAQLYTPYPTFGAAEAQDRSSLWQSAASIGFTLGNSQLEEMDEELGLPIRDREADAAEAAQAMAAMQAYAGTDEGSDPGPDTGGAKGKTPTALPDTQREDTYA